MTNTNTQIIDPILRLPEILAATGARSRQTIYNWIKAGKFPKPLHTGGNSIGWLKSEVESWQEQLKAKRGAQ